MAVSCFPPVGGGSPPLQAINLTVGGNYPALFEHYPREHLPLAMSNRR